jgi:hypothetical protein
LGRGDRLTRTKSGIEFYQLTTAFAGGFFSIGAGAFHAIAGALAATNTAPHIPCASQTIYG